MIKPELPSPAPSSDSSSCASRLMNASPARKRSRENSEDEATPTKISKPTGTFPCAYCPHVYDKKVNRVFCLFCFETKVTGRSHHRTRKGSLKKAAFPRLWCCEKDEDDFLFSYCRFISTAICEFMPLKACTFPLFTQRTKTPRDRTCFALPVTFSSPP